MLRLLDGRAAVVNCESKFKERMAEPVGKMQSWTHKILEILGKPKSDQS